MIVIHIFCIILFIYLASTLGYLWMLAIAGRFGRLRRYTTAPEKARISVLIPSYKEDNVIVDTARQALLQQYPADRYTVTVIADNLRPETVQELKGLPVRVVEVLFEKSMKAKSLHEAFRQSDGQYDLAMVLDADNLMSADVLEKVNHAFQSGWQVVQCHRTAKNKNTSVAVLDALSEEVNNTMFRSGQRVAWDEAAGKFTDDKINAQYLMKEYHNGYQLPVV